MTLKEDWARWRRRRRGEETLDDIMYRVKHADYVIETGESGMGAIVQGMSEEEIAHLEKHFLEKYGINLRNPDGGGPTWI